MTFLGRIKGFFSFISDSWVEMKKVRWPSRRELVSYTSVVVLCVLIVTVYFWGVDLGINKLLDMILK